tara:strand:+ start:250 stop:435 length:186 start_codon:yes stop_codon:yes gene_type:complete
MAHPLGKGRWIRLLKMGANEDKHSPAEDSTSAHPRRKPKNRRSTQKSKRQMVKLSKRRNRN